MLLIKPVRRVRSLALAIAAAFVAACASVPAATKDQTLRVMTYNIQYGQKGLDSVIDVIRAEKPDIVGLQEVDVHWSERSNFVDQAALIARGTAMNYRFARIYQLPNADSSKPPREFGVALLSKYPIISYTNRVITRLSSQQDNPAPQPLPGFLEATVDMNGKRVKVFNVHLDYRRDPAVRAQQVADMLRYVGDVSAPALMVGDMNAKPSAPELQPLFQRFRDTWMYAEDSGWTMPSKKPAEKIDYVLASNHFRAIKSWVPRVYASDHFPVVVDLSLLSVGARKGIE